MILEKKKELNEKRERMEGETVSVLCRTALWDCLGTNFEAVSCATWY